MKKLNLEELVELAVENNVGYSKKEVREIIKGFTSIMESFVVDALFFSEEEVKVTIPNLGTFTVKNREARQGRNPKTGEVVDIPSSKALTFKQATNMKNLLND